MATKVLGTDIRLYIKESGTSKPIACEKSCTITINVDTEEATRSPYTTWKTYHSTFKSFTLSGEGLFLVGGDSSIINHKTFFNFLINGTILDFTVETDVRAGGIEPYTGKLRITSLTLNANSSDIATYSFTAVGEEDLQFTGW